MFFLHKSVNECLEGPQIMIAKLLETIKMPPKLQTDKL